MDDCDVLALEVFGDPRTRERALLIVAAAGPERQVARRLVGELRIGRGRRDLQNPFLRIDAGGRDRRAGTEVTGDEYDTLRHQIVGDDGRLLRIALVVTLLQLQLLTHDAAGLV